MYDQYQARKQAIEKKHQAEETHLPWDQQPGESDGAFTAFRIYLTLGYSRSAEKVAMRLYGDGWEGKARHVLKWMEEYSWEKRALLYDRDVTDHTEDYIQQQRNHVRRRFAEALPDIAEKTIALALGESKGDRVQAGMINTIYDRGGLPKEQAAKQAQQFNFHIAAPELPKEVTGQLTDDAEEDIEEAAKKLIPTKFSEDEY